MDRILDQDFSEAERELLRTGFTILIRLGDDSIEDIRIPGDSRYGDEGPEPQQHCMPIIDDNDSPILMMTCYPPCSKCKDLGNFLIMCQCHFLLIIAAVCREHHVHAF